MGFTMKRSLRLLSCQAELSWLQAAALSAATSTGGQIDPKRNAPARYILEWDTGRFRQVCTLI